MHNHEHHQQEQLNKPNTNEQSADMLTAEQITGTNLIRRMMTDQPSNMRPQDLLTLQRTVGNQAVLRFLRQNTGHVQRDDEEGQQAPAPPPQPPQPAPRQDYIFIMGQDSPRTRNPFYRMARRYFSDHYPQAIMVEDQRSLDGVLSYIATNVQDPIGNIYIVAHANEDGTLSFGLNQADLVQPGHPPVGQTGDSRLSLRELQGALDPTSTTPLTQLANQIDAQTTIRIKGCNIGQNMEMLNAIDQAFGGAGGVVAPTHKQVYGVDRHGSYEALAAPMLERPGNTRYTRDEIQAIVDERYTHLPARDRTRLVTRLFGAQRIDRRTVPIFRDRVPHTAQQASAFFRNQMRQQGFTPDRRQPPQLSQNASGDTISFQYEFTARDGSTMTFTIGGIPTDAIALIDGRNAVGNPDDFTWAASRQWQGDRLTVNAVGTRVLASTSRQTLDPSTGGHFTPPETNATFYTESTYQPAPQAQP